VWTASDVTLNCKDRAANAMSKWESDAYSIFGLFSVHKLLKNDIVDENASKRTDRRRSALDDVIVRLSEPSMDETAIRSLMSGWRYANRCDRVKLVSMTVHVCNVLALHAQEEPLR